MPVERIHGRDARHRVQGRERLTARRSAQAPTLFFAAASHNPRTAGFLTVEGFRSHTTSSHFAPRCSSMNVLSLWRTCLQGTSRK